MEKYRSEWSKAGLNSHISFQYWLDFTRTIQPRTAHNWLSQWWMMWVIDKNIVFWKFSKKLQNNWWKHVMVWAHICQLNFFVYIGLMQKYPPIFFLFYVSSFYWNKIRLINNVYTIVIYDILPSIRQIQNAIFKEFPR